MHPLTPPRFDRRSLLLGLGAAAALAGCGARAVPVAPPPGPRPSPVEERRLALPPRPKRASTGSAFLQANARATGAERERAILREVLTGNVPEFERRLARVVLTAPERTGARGEIWVIPDYLAIGSDADFVRMPMSARTAQKIARATGCVLPTPRLVDAIYEAAAGKLTSPTMAPGPEMTHVAYFVAHERAVEERRREAGIRAGVLTAGHKKDIVLTKRLRAAPGRLAIYGWFREDGSRIQPVSTVHDDEYVDYSNGTRLVDSMMRVDGVPRSLASVLEDPALWPLVSDEGPTPIPEYAM